MKNNKQVDRDFCGEAEGDFRSFSRPLEIEDIVGFLMSNFTSKRRVTNASVALLLA